MTFVPSGEQFEITRGDQHAVVVEVGGGVRAYDVGDRAVLESYPVDAMCDGAHGTPLIPWPNRLGDGRYTFDGVEHCVALTEPAKRNAIHGLLRWRSWSAREHTRDRVTMGIVLHPMTGYPFALDVEVAYALDDEGLRVTTTATNVGDRACPYATGQHPYLSAGGGLLDDCTLELAAATRIDTDAVRQLPTGTDPVAGTELDFRERRTIGATAMDFAFTDLVRDSHGRAWVRLGRPDGSAAELWADESYPYIELYTGDALAPARRRRGLGTEPMTCPPDAFRARVDVIRLEPGQSASATWGARLS